MSAVRAIRVLAHQGGWDELVFVAAPLVLFAVLLVIARRKVDAESERSNDDERRDP